MSDSVKKYFEMQEDGKLKNSEPSVDTFDFEKFKLFVNNYKETDYTGQKQYSNEVIIKDMIYGLGISLNDVKYSWATGFKKFKLLLINKILTGL